MTKEQKKIREQIRSYFDNLDVETPSPDIKKNLELLEQKNQMMITDWMMAISNCKKNLGKIIQRLNNSNNLIGLDSPESRD